MNFEILHIIWMVAGALIFAAIIMILVLDTIKGSKPGGKFNDNCPECGKESHEENCIYFAGDELDNNH